MDIFGAIQVLHTPRLLLMHIQHPTAEERQQAMVEWQLFQAATDVIDSDITYRELTTEEGHRAAFAALNLFDVGPKTSDYEYLPHHILTNLANGVPGSLHGLYPEFLQRDLDWDANSLFREADPWTEPL